MGAPGLAWKSSWDFNRNYAAGFAAGISSILMGSVELPWVGCISARDDCLAKYRHDDLREVSS